MFIKMDLDDYAKQIVGWCFAALVAVAIWHAKRIIDTQDKTLEIVGQLNSKIWVLEAKFENSKHCKCEGD